MSSVINNFIKEIESQKKKVNAVKSKQVRSLPLREEMRRLVEDYFKLIRPTIISDNANDDDVGKVDDQMQELLQLCHKNGSRNNYIKRLNLIRKLIITLDSRIIANTPITTTLINSIDIQIIETLSKILPSASVSYRQALTDLHEEKRFSWRGPATDLRECLRETLDYLAPDKEVESMPGYKLERDTHGPTMKQKVRYLLTKRGISKVQSATAENAADSVENIVGTFVRSVYTRSSISTHTPTDKSEVLRIKNFVRATLCELLEINI
jgi:hypothetical protein